MIFHENHLPAANFWWPFNGYYCGTLMPQVKGNSMGDNYFFYNIMLFPVFMTKMLSTFSSADVL